MPNPKQSYKEKCLEQFEEQFKDSFTYGAMETWEDGLAVRDFISKALDNQMKEVMECLPQEKPMSVFSFVLRGEELEDYMKAKGWNTYRGKLLDNLEDKGLI